MISDADTRTLNWTVGPPNILEESRIRGNVFWIGVYQYDSPWISLNSRAFNVTNSFRSVSATFAVTSTASMTTTTASPSQMQTAAVTTAATETVSIQPTSSSVAANDRKSLAIGLGVGLGLSASMALAIVVLGFWCCIARPRRDTISAVKDSAAETARVDTLDPPPKYRKHELSDRD